MLTTFNLIARLQLIFPAGFATHHMREDNEVVYEEKLRLLEPVVRQLSRKSQFFRESENSIANFFVSAVGCINAIKKMGGTTFSVLKILNTFKSNTANISLLKTYAVVR
jgi:hypothetical protein